MPFKMTVLNFFVPLLVLTLAAMVPFVAARADTPAPTGVATAFASPIQTAAGPTRSGAMDLKSPARRARKDCNGTTSSECCAGLSYCTCLYMPGSTDNHPTACFKGTPPRNG